MPEPKKETVRIVLPARRDGLPVTSSPRETAMINLPPKPVPVPGGPVPATPLGLRPPPPSVLPASAIPKPPSAPGMPAISTLPATAGGSAPADVLPSLSKPPVAPPAAPASSGPPKPPSVLPAASIAPSAPKPPSGVGSPVKPVAPAPLQGETKKETAKVPASTPGAKVGMPQATVQMQKKPPIPVSGSTSGIMVVPSGDKSTGEELPLMLGIAALAVAALSLGMQLWMMLG